MALNRYMHPRNRYRDNRPDFAALAGRCPDFAGHLALTSTGRLSLDFRDPAALRALTRALLREDFGLDVELPLDRLIPTVPLRLNYVLWVEDLLSPSGGPSRWTDVHGIDIGCGASCIYPLLGAKLNGWSFTATEVDASSATYASLNVKRNNLHDKIQVLEASPDDMLCGALRQAPRPLYHFAMCNPPFFGNLLEAQGIMASRSLDRPQPGSVSTAAESEMVWEEGGEVAFVRRLIADSLRLGQRVIWYTSMIGKKSSLAPIKQELAKHKIQNVTTTEFCQGRTMRWGIGWTFYQDIDSPVSPSAKRFKRGKERPPLVIRVPTRALEAVLRGASPGGSGDQPKVKAIAKVLEGLLKSLEIKIKPKPGSKQSARYDLEAARNTWANQRRKRRQSLRRRRETEEEEEEGPGREAKEARPDMSSAPTDAVGHSPSAGVRRPTSDTNGTDCTVTESARCAAKGLAAQKAADDSVPTAEEDVTAHRVTAVVAEENAAPADHNQTVKGTPRTTERACTDSGRRELPSSDTITSDDDAKEPPETGLARDIDRTERSRRTDGASSDEARQPPEGGRGDEGLLFECTLTVKGSEGSVAVELGWTGGRSREAMHQVGQYIKNQLSQMAPSVGDP